MDRQAGASAQAAAGVSEEQVDTASVGDEVVVHGARALLLGLAHQPLKVGEEAVDGAAEVRVATVALGYLIEAHPPFGRVDRAHHDAALAGAEARPDGR